MFEDGLHHKVNIFPLERNTSNRKEKAQMANSKEPIFKDIKCRIIREEKALFNSNICLEAGYVIENLLTGERYEVLKRKKVYGMTMQHHATYEIRKKVI